MNPEPTSHNINFSECENALLEIGRNGSYGDEQALELLNNLRVAARRLHLAYSDMKAWSGLERAERVAPRVEETLDRIINVLREHSLHYVIPDGKVAGELQGVPLDAYQEIGAWITQIEAKKASLLLDVDLADEL